jgi:hypothetical protein
MAGWDEAVLVRVARAMQRLQLSPSCRASTLLLFHRVMESSLSADLDVEVPSVNQGDCVLGWCFCGGFSWYACSFAAAGHLSSLPSRASILPRRYVRNWPGLCLFEAE